MDGGLRANLALDKPATQSSTCDWSRSRIPEEDARGANNGVTPDDFGFHTGRELNPWWQVDLQGEYVVREVMIFNRTHMAQRLRHFSILASLDGSTWATVFSKRDPLIFGQTGEKPYVVKIPDGRLGRFIRLRLDGHDCLHAREIQVFGELPRPDSIKDLRERENRMLEAERASGARQTGSAWPVDGRAHGALGRDRWARGFRRCRQPWPGSSGSDRKRQV
jgi:hypothetical protein